MYKMKELVEVLIDEFHISPNAKDMVSGIQKIDGADFNALRGEVQFCGSTVLFVIKRSSYKCEIHWLRYPFTLRS